MLVFVIPLQSPEASHNWEKVAKLCKRTVMSVCAQSCAEFHVYVVCHEKPPGLADHPSLTVIQDRFPIPESNRPSRMRDKWLKLKVGLIAARHHAPAHVMIMDADDCVHQGLAALSAQKPQAHGWIFDVGYLHDEGSRWLLRWYDFDKYCGTSAIVRLDASELPTSTAERNDDYFILTKSHEEIQDFLQQRKTPAENLPFVGTIYITGTGDNDSGIAVKKLRGKRMMLRKLFWSRPLTPAIRSRYGLYEIDD